MTEQSRFHIASVYGEAHVNKFGKEAHHTGVYVDHPDRTITLIGDGPTSAINAKVSRAMNNWREAK